MQIQQTYYKQQAQQQQIFKGNKFSKLRVVAAKNVANRHAADIIDWKPVFNIHRGMKAFGAAFMISHPIYSIVTRDSSHTFLDVLMSISSYGYFKGSEKLHNVALQKSQILVEELQKRGFKQKEIVPAVKSFIRQTGDFIHSPLFLATKKSKIKALANGEIIA